MADKTVAVISDGAWLANTTYHVGDTVSNDSLKIYKCITAGTSAASGGPTGTGTDITDNTAHWAYQETVGAAYTSLNAAYSGESGDLVTNTCILTIRCYNFLDETAADTGGGYTVSSSYYINTIAVDSHLGVYGTNAYRISPLAAGSVIANNTNYYRITGVQIYAKGNSGTGYNAHGIFLGNDTVGCHAKKCIVKGSNADRTNGSDYYGIYLTGVSSSGHLIYDNIIYDFIDTGNRGISINYSTGNFFNNTVYNCTVGFVIQQDVTASVKNCLTVDCGDGYNGSFSGSCSNNGSDIASDAPGTDSVDLSAYADTDIFNDPANDDFHLKSDSPCINVGVDLSATFTDDIDGETRPTGAGTWDIGADEYISGIISGTTCWGHSTGVTEVNTRTFATNWTGTGRVVGSGDSEKILLSTGQYMESEVVQIGGTIIYTKDKYQSGYGSVTMKYRTGATQVACEAASYSTYTVPVASSGYFQVRLEA